MTDQHIAQTVFGGGDKQPGPSKKKGKNRDFRDENVYLNYKLPGADTEKG